MRRCAELRAVRESDQRQGVDDFFPGVIGEHFRVMVKEKGQPIIRRARVCCQPSGAWECPAPHACAWEPSTLQTAMVAVLGIEHDPTR